MDSAKWFLLVLHILLPLWYLAFTCICAFSFDQDGQMKDVWGLFAYFPMLILLAIDFLFFFLVYLFT